MRSPRRAGIASARTSDQPLVDVDTLRSNKRISLDRQMRVAEALTSQPAARSSTLTWNGPFPTATQVQRASTVLFDLTGSGNGVRTARQLGARINIPRYNRGNIRALVHNQMQNFNDDADEAVEDTLDFIPNWAQFKIPTAFTTVGNSAFPCTTGVFVVHLRIRVQRGSADAAEPR